MTPDAMIAADLIRRHEGLRLFVYDDKTGKSIASGDAIEGHPSIGYGRNLTSARGISEAEAEVLLANDIEAAIAVAKWFAGKACWSRLNDVRRAVLIDMAHNLGAKRLARFVLMRQAISAGDYEVAADEMLDSLWSRQVGERSRSLAAMITSGEMSEEGTA